MIMMTRMDRETKTAYIVQRSQNFTQAHKRHKLFNETNAFKSYLCEQFIQNINLISWIVYEIFVVILRDEIT